MSGRGVIRWLRRRLGIEDLEQRVAKLDGVEPAWARSDGAADKRREVTERFEVREPGVRLGPTPTEGLGWRREAADEEAVPEIRRRHGGPYL